jgi:5'-nucleotidase
MKRAVVTNDDGVESLGLRCLADAACAAGLEVAVAAPVADSSGTSASISAAKTGGHVLVERRAWEPHGVPVYAVAAAPGFIALTAVHGAYGGRPDVVLSGINHGANTGRVVLHSGTVGAALTAVAHGCPAIAVSLCAGTPLYWETAASVVARALDWLAALPRPLALNVNVPNVPVGDLAGIVAADLAPFGTVQTTVAETHSDDGLITVAMGELGLERPAGSDARLVAEGFATVTALEPLCPAVDVRLDRLMARSTGSLASRAARGDASQ